MIVVLSLYIASVVFYLLSLTNILLATKKLIEREMLIRFKMSGMFSFASFIMLIVGFIPLFNITVACLWYLPEVRKNAKDIAMHNIILRRKD